MNHGNHSFAARFRNAVCVVAGCFPLVVSAYTTTLPSPGSLVITNGHDTNFLLSFPAYGGGLSDPRGVPLSSLYTNSAYPLVTSLFTATLLPFNAVTNTFVRVRIYYAGAWAYLTSSLPAGVTYVDSRTNTAYGRTDLFFTVLTNISAVYPVRWSVPLLGNLDLSTNIFFYYQHPVPYSWLYLTETNFYFNWVGHGIVVQRTPVWDSLNGTGILLSNQTYTGYFDPPELGLSDPPGTLPGDYPLTNEVELVYAQSLDVAFTSADYAAGHRVYTNAPFSISSFYETTNLIADAGGGGGGSSPTYTPLITSLEIVAGVATVEGSNAPPVSAFQVQTIGDLTTTWNTNYTGTTDTNGGFTATFTAPVYNIGSAIVLTPIPPGTYLEYTNGPAYNQVWVTHTTWTTNVSGGYVPCCFFRAKFP